MNAIVRLTHLRSGYGEGQKTFLAPSADKKTRNYDTGCSKHRPFLSTLKSKGFSHSKMKWWAIYTNSPVNATVRLPHPPSRDIQSQEMFSAPSTDKQTRNYDIEWSKHHPSLSTLRSIGLNRSKMKWWAIYTNLPMNAIVRLPHPRSGYSQSHETLLVPSGDKQTRNYDKQCSNHHLLLSTLCSKGLSCSKMKYMVSHIFTSECRIVNIPIASHVCQICFS